VGDHVQVDRARQVHHPVDHRTVEHLLEPGAAAGPHDQLGGVLGPGEVGEGGGRVGAGHLVVLAAHLGQQAAVLFEHARRR
jgi:hypothetical protein